ncbi:MAG TPA: choice-of-anchor Q domain-containing protein, partial [Anaerolineales bacterium]|nr:choice-of-anchor Q domain-containing protein [Anaerolineales bacterium]
SGDEIWVATGVYKPTSGTDRSVSFVLKNGVAVYGGFAGTEILRDQRDLALNPTILSGDIGILYDNSDNSYHVVVGSNTDNTTVLDNFLITGGNANAYPHDKGGGIYNDRGSPTIMAVSIERNYATFGGGMYNGDTQNGMTSQGSHPILVNVNFISNSAVEGGGMENQFSSSPSITNAWFYANTAIRSGGGMLNMYNSSPTLTRTDFVENLAAAGGGMANDQSSPSLTDVTFRRNSASAYGGGMSNDNYSNAVLRNVTFSGNTAIDAMDDDTYGGGMSNYLSSPALTNVTFHNNSATYGGGILNRDGNSNPTLIHVTMSGNRAFITGGGIANSGNVVIRNSILWGNEGGEVFNVYGTVDVTNSIVQGGYSGAGNLDADPLLGPLQSNGRGLTETMELLPGSPAIDAGDDANCPSADQRGVTRPQGSHCDIGAYEYEFPVSPTPTYTPTPTLTPTNTPTPTATSRPGKPTKTPRR